MSQQALIRVDRTETRPDQFSLAEWLGVSNKTAWRLVGSGAVQSVKVGGRRLVVPESVEAYIARGGDA